MTSFCIDGEIYPSKVEAHWAVYLRRLRVRHYHEPFVCQQLGRTSYIPDFYLPDYQMVLEIKLSDVSLLDLDRWRTCLASVPGGVDLVVASGAPPGIWFAYFRQAAQVPHSMDGLLEVWQYGHVPELEHSARMSSAAGGAWKTWQLATDAQLRERRKALDNLPTWQEWLT